VPVVFFGASLLLPYSRHSPRLAHYLLAAAVPQVEMLEADLPEQAGGAAPQVEVAAGIPQVEVGEVPREVVGVPVMGAAVLRQEVAAVIRELAILEAAAVVIRSVVAVAALAADMR
jgi:hypothetical protein